MSRHPLPTLPNPTDLGGVIARFPVAWPALLDAHDQILRGPATLSIGDRELIAAYVSALNGCAFCTAAHTSYAERYGAKPGVVDALVADPTTAAVDVAMRPILQYARALTLHPGVIGDAEIKAILAAGWTEESVMETAMVVALFNFMNRIVTGMGVAPFAERYREQIEAIRRLPMARRLEANQRDIGTRPYREYGKSLGIVAE